MSDASRGTSGPDRSLLILAVKQSFARRKSGEAMPLGCAHARPAVA
jgi:hypothetical protein